MSAEHRKHHRFSYSSDAVVTYKGERCECVVLNISASGAAFKSAWRPDVGASVEIRFNGKIPVKGQVARHMDEGFAVTSVWDLKSINNE